MSAREKDKTSRFGLLDIVRCMVAFFAAVLIDLVGSTILGGYIEEALKASGSEINILWLSLSNLVLYFGMDFVAIYLALFIVRKKYRVIGGVVLLYGLFFFMVVNISYSNLVLFLNSVVQLSASATGAILAILCHTTFGKKPQQTALQNIPQDLNQLLTIQRQNISKRPPTLSKVLLGLALLSVPSTYIALIISSFIVLGLSVWGLVLVLQLPRIPIVVLVALGVAPLIGIWISLKALWATFLPKPHFDSTVKLTDPGKYKLFRIVEEVCKTVGTRMPSNILLHSEPTFYVTNAKVQTYDGVVSGRTMAIGIPLLSELELQELKAVLAHEFSHFTGNDTAYSIFVAPVYRSIGSALDDISGFTSESSNETFVNLVKLLLLVPGMFLSTFLSYFALIDRILSRNRELRADWYAAKHYGSDALTQALIKVDEVSRHFSETSNALALNAVDSFFDSYSQALREPNAGLKEYRSQGLAEATGDYDTHPSLATRLTEMPYVARDGSNISPASIVLEELSDEKKRLSALYTESTKGVQKYYQGLKRAKEEPDKYLRYKVTIWRTGAPTVLNEELVAGIAAFTKDEPSKISQFIEANSRIEVSRLTEAQARELITIAKKHVHEKDVQVERQILEEADVVSA